MKKLLIVFLILLFSAFAFSADLITEKDSFAVEKISAVEGLEKVLINDEITAFTSKEFEKKDIFIATDQIFYGSSKGQVDMNIYLGALNPKNYKVAIELENGKRIDVKNYKINQMEVNPKEGLSDSFEISSVSLEKEINYISLTAFFDPEEIGLQTKFNVVVYDILTGEKAGELDPFLSGADQRIPINIGSTHSALVENYTHEIIGVDLSGLNCPDNNALAISWHGTGGAPIEIDALIEGTCGVSTDANIYFMEQTLIPLNTGLNASDTNGYYINSFDETRASPKRDCNEVFTFCDDFEDGALTGWSNTTDFDALTNQAYQGLFSMEGNTHGAMSYINQAMAIDTNANQWFRFTNVGGASGMIIGISANGGSGYEVAWRVDEGGTGKFRLFNGATYSDCTGTNPNVQADHWYLSRMHLTASGTYDAYIFDSDGSTVLCHNVGVSTDTGGSFVVFTDSDSGTTYQDYVYLQQGIDVNPEYTFGAIETPINDYNVIFNVYQGNGTQFDLTNINIDFNVDAYDQTGVNSPVTINDINVGTYSITISKNEWDSNSFELTVDENKNLTYTINKFTYPDIAQFDAEGTTNTSQSAYQNIATFSYDTAFGSSTQNDISCSLWLSTNNTAESEVSYRLQTSENGNTWTTRKETTITVSANVSGDAFYIATSDFNVGDGTHYFRVQHKRGNSEVFTLSTHDMVCHSFIARDQNNFYIADLHDTQTSLSTTTSDYNRLVSGSVSTNEFNGFFYYYGDLTFNQTVSDGNSFILGGLENVEDSNSAEFGFTMLANTMRISGFSGFFEDLNRSTSYNLETFGKTSAGTISLDYDVHLKYLNQRTNSYDQNKALAGTTTTSNTLEKIATLNITPQTQGDFRVIYVLPFSCSEADCDVNTLIGVSGEGYDSNSFNYKTTTSSSANHIEMVTNQFLFEDVNAGNITVDLYASTSTGTITIQGGSFSVIKANQTEVSTEFPPNPPLVFAPTNGSEVSGSPVDYNCFATDPDNDPLTYDVNVVYKASGLTALELETGGDGYGNFNSSLLSNGLYALTCVVTDGNFSATFDNTDYNFTINNPAPPTPTQPLGEGYERYYAPYDDRIDLVDKNKFVNGKLVGNESALLRNDEQGNYLLMGIIILLVVLILVSIIGLRGKK